VVERDGSGDVGCAEADAFEDQRHERLKVDPRVALPRDTGVLPAGGPLGLRRHGPERFAGIDVAVAILVTDQATPAGFAFQHRHA
jgi:hypothetical protein